MDVCKNCNHEPRKTLTREAFKTDLFCSWECLYEYLEADCPEENNV